MNIHQVVSFFFGTSNISWLFLVAKDVGKYIYFWAVFCQNHVFPWKYSRKFLIRIKLSLRTIVKNIFNNTSWSELKNSFSQEDNMLVEIQHFVFFFFGSEIRLHLKGDAEWLDLYYYIFHPALQVMRSRYLLMREIHVSCCSFMATEVG